MIPARNEEKNIESSVMSACNQEYSNFEVLVLNDRSTDKTGTILNRLEHRYSEHLRVFEGQEKPSGWLGKPWACDQLARKASGDILLFIDADVTLNRNVLSRVSTVFGDSSIDALTIWPRQVLKSAWEKMLLPIVYYALLVQLPVAYVHRSPRWLPAPLNRTIRNRFGVACGQFIAFRKKIYKSIGGHRQVRREVAEDIALGRRLLADNRKLLMFEGSGTVSCRMYRSRNEIHQGFRRNILSGFNESIALSMMTGLIHFISTVLPFVVLPVSLIGYRFELIFLSASAITIVLAQRLVIARWFDWNPIWGLTHPFATLWFLQLGVTAVIDRIKNRPVYWKDRAITRRSP